MRTKAIFTATIIAAGSMLLSSCENFLKENSQNLAYAETATQLNELIVGECFVGWMDYKPPGSQKTMQAAGSTGDVLCPWLFIMDDDAEEFLRGATPLTEITPRNYLSCFYAWQKELFINNAQKLYADCNWERFYKHIAALNAIIYRVKDIRTTDPDQQLCNRVEGEARFLRAYYYFMLANIYAAPYCKATAATDLCVPLKLTEMIEDKHFSRDTQEQVWGQIVADLVRADECLAGIRGASNLRAGEYTPAALLSRVYLYMEDYENAIKYADKVIGGGYKINDLNDHTAGQNVIYRTSGETIFAMSTYSSSFIFRDESPSTSIANFMEAQSFRVSQDLLDSYSQNDLRRSFFFRPSVQGYASLPDKMARWSTADNKPESISDVMSVRLPEVILNKAEALAAQGGHDEQARATLDLLRSKRFLAQTMPEITATGSALIEFVRAERRRELCFECHRWFDLRRYAVNVKHPQLSTIRHNVYEFNAQTLYTSLKGYYELKPYTQDKAAWIIPVPRNTIQFNFDTMSNEPRTERSLNTL